MSRSLAVLVLAALAAAALAPAAEARSESFEPSDEELAGFVKRNFHTLPDFVRENPTRDMLRAYLSPATVDVTMDGKVLQTIVVDGPGSDQGLTVAQESETIDPSVIWQIGKDVWDLVMANKAVANATVDWAGAVPANVTSWTNMTGWQTEKDSKTYKFEFKNFLGIKLTEMTWQFYFNYGGAFEGVGAYLTNAGLLVGEVYAIDTENIQATASALHAVNVGTANAPVAGLTIINNCESHGLFKKTEVSCSAAFTGHGSVKILSCAQN